MHQKQLPALYLYDGEVIKIQILSKVFKWTFLQWQNEDTNVGSFTPLRLKKNFL